MKRSPLGRWQLMLYCVSSRKVSDHPGIIGKFKNLFFGVEDTLQLLAVSFTIKLKQLTCLHR